MTTVQRLASQVTAVLRSDSIPQAWGQAGWTLLRVVAGLVMIHNGLDKLADIPGFATAYVEVIGLPFPIFFAYVAALTELVAAPLLALGLFTRPAAFGLFSTMAVAMFHHIKVAGFSIPYLELSMLYAACFLAFAINGSGRFSLDHLLASAIESYFTKTATQRLESLETSYQVTEAIMQAAKDPQIAE